MRRGRRTFTRSRDQDRTQEQPGVRALVEHPDHPGIPVNCDLVIGDGVDTQISISFARESPPPWLSSPERVSRLFITFPEEITLEDVYYVGNIARHHGPSYRFRSNVAFAGACFSKSPPLFEEIGAFIPGGIEWFQRSGISNNIGFADSPERLTVEYRTQGDCEWTDSDGSKYKYAVEPTVEWNYSPSRFSIEETALLTFTPVASSTFRDASRQLGKLRSFIEFFSEAPVQVGSMHGHAEQTEVAVKARWKQSRIINLGAPWFVPYRCVERNFEEHLRAWLHMYRTVPLALDIYRVSKSGSIPSTVRLYSLVAAIEAIDEFTSTRKGKRNLQTRLYAIADYPSVRQVLSKKDTERLVRTRNYIAHQAERSRANIIEEEDWAEWSERLEVVIELLILRVLPFASEEARERIASQRATLCRSVLGISHDPDGIEPK